jgi:hypothetical protein
MAQSISIDIGTGFYESDSLPFANQRCVNLYPVTPQAPALKSSALFNTHGLTEVARTSGLARDRNRGGWVFNDVPYFVNGTSLFRVDRMVNFGGQVTYETARIGTVDGSGFCSFADNGYQMLIINDNGTGYIYEPTASPSFYSISDAGFYANGTPKKVVFVDSYFIVSTDLDRAIISAPLDGNDWNSLDRITAEANPDGVVAPLIIDNQLYLVGTRTIESYQNIGGAGVPFQRNSGFVVPKGCSAADTIINVGAVSYFVGRGQNEQPMVLMFDGNTTTKISTTAIDNKLHELTETQLASMFSWAYTLRGNQFVGFTSSEFCFVFDPTVGKWHERESQVLSRGVVVTQPCRLRSVLGAYNELLVGDSQDGRIGIIDADVYREYDNTVVSFFTTSPLYTLGNSFSLPMVELLCESGVGNDQKAEPEVRMQISNDGATFSQPRTRLLGRIGQHKLRQIWRKNGRISQFAVFKISISDPVKRRLFGLELKIKQGNGNV